MLFTTTTSIKVFGTLVSFYLLLTPVFGGDAKSDLASRLSEEAKQNYGLQIEPDSVEVFSPDNNPDILVAYASLLDGKDVNTTSDALDSGNGPDIGFQCTQFKDQTQCNKIRLTGANIKGRQATLSLVDPKGETVASEEVDAIKQRSKRYRIRITVSCGRCLINVYVNGEYVGTFYGSVTVIFDYGRK